MTYTSAPEARSRRRERTARLCRSADARPRAQQVFLQRFGIEPMQPDGQRVSTLATDTPRERATVRPRTRAALLPAPPADAQRRQVDEKCVSCGKNGLSFHTMQVRLTAAVLCVASPLRLADGARRGSCAPRTRGRRSSSSACTADTSGLSTRERQKLCGIVRAVARLSCGGMRPAHTRARARAALADTAQLRACCAPAICGDGCTSATRCNQHKQRRCAQRSAAARSLRSANVAASSARAARARASAAPQLAQQQRKARAAAPRTHALTYGPRITACRGSGPSVSTTAVGRSGPFVITSGMSAPASAHAASAAPIAPLLRPRMRRHECAARERAACAVAARLCA